MKNGFDHSMFLAVMMSSRKTCEKRGKSKPAKAVRMPIMSMKVKASPTPRMFSRT